MKKRIKFILVGLLVVLLVAYGAVTTVLLIKNSADKNDNLESSHIQSSLDSSQDEGDKESSLPSLDSSPFDSSSSEMLPENSSSSMLEDSSSSMPQDELMKIEGVTFNGASYYYDGTQKEILIEGELPKGVFVAYQDNSATQVGIYYAKAMLFGEGYETLVLEATLEIKALKIFQGIVFESASYYYDGNQKCIQISGELPADARVDYEGNTAVEVGVYQAIATLSCEGYESLTLCATLEIKQLKNFEGIVFESQMFYYDGTKKSIFIAGDIPQNATVTYLENGVAAVGKHDVIAIVECEGYETIYLAATITIVRQITGITFESASYYYDSTEKVIKISGVLPSGVSVEYKNNKATESGVYEAIATLFGDGYETLVLRATLTIMPNKVIDGVVFEDKLFYYDGTPKTLEIQGALPDGVTVRYENNVQIEEGVYEVVAILSGKGYNDMQLIAYLTIVKLKEITNISFDDVVYTYDGSQKRVIIAGELPSGVTVKYENNSAVNAGEYMAKAILSGEGYVEKTLEAKLTIQRASLDYISLLPKTVFYNGSKHSLALSEVLPNGVVAEYYYNGEQVDGVSNIGTYQVKVSLYGDNYISKTLEATLIIKSAQTPVLSVASSGQDVYFNGYTSTYGISKCNLQNNKITNLNSDFAQHMVAVGSGICYVSGGKIYKMDANGNTSVLCVANAGELVYDGKNLYFCVASGTEDARGIYKISTSAQNATPTKITQATSNSFAVYGDMLYYSNAKDQGKLYKISVNQTNGQGELLSGRASSDIVCDGQYIYFIASSSFGNIYKYSLSSGACEKICGLICDELNKVGNYLYFINKSSLSATGVGKNICRLSLGGGEVQDFLSCDSGFRALMSAGQDLYYLKGDGSGIYRYAVGTGREYLL